MLGALHMLGAGDGLAGHFLVAKVDNVDSAKLKKGLADSGASGAVAPAIMMVVDKVPPDVINATLPMLASYLEKNYGIKSTIVLNDDPKARGVPTKPSGFFLGLGLGSGVTALVALVGWGTWKLLLSKIF